VTGINMVAGILTARFLGATGRGELAALTTLPVFFSFVMTFGLPSGLIYHARHSADDMPGFTAAAIVLTLIAGIVGASIAYVATPHVLTELTPSLMPAAQALVIFTVLGVLSQIMMAALQAQHEFLAFNYIRVAQPVVQLLGTLILAAGDWMTPLSAALVIMLAGLPASLWNLKWILTTCRPAWSKWIDSARRLYSYSLRAYGGELLLGMAAQVDKVIVVGIFSPAMMGLYVVALSLSRVVAMFPSAVVSVLFPKASGRSPADVTQITARATAGTALLVGAAAIALIVLGPALLALIYGSDFAQAAFAFRLLVVEAALSSIVQVMSQAFMALNRPGLVTLQYGSGAIVATPLLFALTPRWGVEGAAAALLMASAVRLACVYWCFSGAMKMHAPDVVGQLGEAVRSIRSAVRAVLR
jgi:O-antigen/teichoic acid export membrane protein